MLSNRNLVFVFVVGPNEEEYPTEEQCEQTTNIAQHRIQFIMGSCNLVDSPSFLDLNAYVMGRVQIYCIRVMAGDVVALRSFLA